MDTLQPEVKTALTGTGYTVTYFYPQSGLALPTISWREGQNRVFSRADSNEYLTEVEYIVDLWASTPETTATMALAVDTALSAIGLERTFSHDLYEIETRIHHKSMRYLGVIHIAQQKVYKE